MRKSTVCAAFLVLYGIVSSKSQEIILPNPHRGERFRSATFDSIQGIAAKNVTKTVNVMDDFECLHQCLSHTTCQSFNFQTTGNPTHLCELCDNSMTSPSCQEPRPGYTYFYPIKNKRQVPASCVDGQTCKNGGTCEPACNERGYVCKCQPFNKGEHCELWTTGVTSCKDILSKTSHRKDMAYTFVIDSNQTTIYCHLSSLCASGGWTLAMKIDGSITVQFGYSSALWSNKESYNLTAGQSGFDNHQTKLPSYWAMSFTKLCVGMKVGNDLRWITIPYSASSLYDVISDGRTRAFNIGRATWLSLVAGSTLQHNCNAQAFNTYWSRIGIDGNNENDCRTPDSFIGFGVGRRGWRYSCGNNGPGKTIAAFGYILIQ